MVYSDEPNAIQRTGAVALTTLSRHLADGFEFVPLAEITLPRDPGFGTLKSSQSSIALQGEPGIIELTAKALISFDFMLDQSLNPKFGHRP